MDDLDKLTADVVAAGPDGLRVKAGWLTLRPDGDFDLRLDPNAGDDPVATDPTGTDDYWAMTRKGLDL